MTVANGDYSHAGGNYTIANGIAQTVIGQYNIEQGTTERSSEDELFIIGNGTGTDASVRSNAHTVGYDGIGWYQSDVKVGGTGKSSATISLTDMKTELSEKVDDVQVDDVSVVTNGVAKIPVAGRTVPGVASVRTEYGISIINKSLCISQASQRQCKGGGTSIGYNPIAPYNQHWATFYGLAKVAGHDEKDSSLAVGEYTSEAKAAIQTMLDVPSNSDVTDLQTSKADKSYVDTQLAGKASTATATTSADGLMSAQDKSKIDAVYADYTSALTALGVI